MKKIALITLSETVLIIVASCTNNLPDKAKAQNAVEHYLDTLYKGSKVDIRGFTDFGTMKDMWEKEKKWTYHWDTDFFKRHPKISEKERVQWRESTDKYYAEKINFYSGYRITCYYNIDFKKHEDIFWIYNDFKTVQTEMYITLLHKREEHMHPFIARNVTVVTPYHK
ncbi:hypothetical protein [Mucilaginibacter sp.]|jgi:hypothetical protein|uniref:hypothetical protein n=1 Tax=Mucilaginibacter sp. TaxID=1882438 RepID=UPI002CEF316E|nr:hypothetical protein [Mucilaginibacter sp.]HTI60587.1 hypothetical protein [Mucilaginibacter sp.]